MKLITVDGFANLEPIIDAPVYVGFNMFVPTDPTIFLVKDSDYQSNGYDFDVVGAEVWMDAELDNLLFDIKGRSLNHATFDLPQNVVIESQFLDLRSSVIGNLKLVSPERFWLRITESVVYYVQSDVLVAYYKREGGNRFSSSMRFSKNMYVLSHDDVITGWALSNCSKNLYSTKLKRIDEPKGDVQRVLADFLVSYSEETFDRINAKDNQIKLKLMAIYERAKIMNVMSICDAIEDWLWHSFDDIIW